MIREVFMPALSSTMTEGKIVSWVKSAGDKVEKGETVVVVESDKADMDVESFYEGYLAIIIVPAGEVAPVGAGNRPRSRNRSGNRRRSAARSRRPKRSSSPRPQPRSYQRSYIVSRFAAKCQPPKRSQRRFSPRSQVS